MVGRRGSAKEPLSPGHAQFGAYLSAARVRSRKSLRDLAGPGHSETSLSKLENGLRHPTDEDLSLYARACSLRLDELEDQRDLCLSTTRGPHLGSPFAGPFTYVSLELTHLVFGRGQRTRCESTCVVRALSDGLEGIAIGVQHRRAGPKVKVRYEDGVGAQVRPREMLGNLQVLWAEFPEPLRAGKTHRFELVYTVDDPDLDVLGIHSMWPPVYTETLTMRIQFNDEEPKKLCYFRGLPGGAAVELFDEQGHIALTDLPDVKLNRFGFVEKVERSVDPNVSCGYCWEWI